MLEEWYNRNLLEEHDKKMRQGQLENCLALINATSRFTIFDNLQPYEESKRMYEEITFIFMNAFNDYINGDSQVDPGSKALDNFLYYAYVRITNQVPIDYNVIYVNAIYNLEMFGILQNIYVNYEGLSVRQAKTIDFIMQQYSNADKIQATPGQIQEYKNGEKLARWG